MSREGHTIVLVEYREQASFRQALRNQGVQKRRYDIRARISCKGVVAESQLAIGLLSRVQGNINWETLQLELSIVKETEVVLGIISYERGFVRVGQSVVAGTGPGEARGLIGKDYKR